MKRLFYILPAFILLLSSCAKEISGDYFKGSFELLTKTIHGGEDFSFNLYSNHSSIEIVEFTSEFARPEDYEKKYSINNGYVTVTIPEVNIEEEHAGKITVKVKDPDTGSTETYSASYTALRKFALSFNIIDYDSKKVSTPRVKDDYPLFVSGDDFKIKVLAPGFKKLTLVDYEFVFNDGALKKDQSYDFNDGELSFNFLDLDIITDHVDLPYRIWMKFRDDSTGEFAEAEAFFYAAVRFVPNVSIITNPLNDGENFSFRIWPNRDLYTIASIYTERDEIRNIKSEIEGVVGSEVISKHDYSILTASKKSSVSINRSGDNAVSFVINVTDVEYTGRTERVTLKYEETKASYIAPTKISLSINDDELYDDGIVYMNMGEKILANVKVYPEDANPNLEIKVKGDKLVTVPSTCDDVLEIAAGNKSGQTTIIISDKLNPSVMFEFAVCVKYNVAFVIDMYDSGKVYSRSNKTYWGAMPSSIVGKFRMIPNGVDILSYMDSDYETLSSALSAFPVMDLNSTTSVTFSLEFDTRVSCTYFYGYNNSIELIKENNTTTGTYPSSTTKKYKESMQNEDSEIVATSLVTDLQNMCCYCHYQDRYGSLWRSYSDHLGQYKTTDYNGNTIFLPKGGDHWKYVNLRVENFDNIPQYNVEYIIYLYKNKQSNVMFGDNNIYMEYYWWKYADKVPMIEAFVKP